MSDAVRVGLAALARLPVIGLYAALAVAGLLVTAELALAQRDSPTEIDPQTPTTDPEAFQEGVEAYDSGDYERAFEIWLPLARNQDMAAQRNVAHLLRRGLGTERDLVRALYFYERAAEGGLPGAQVNAGYMYLKGEGTEKDDKMAAYWFHRAAISGSAAAAYNLAVLYEKGRGVEKNAAYAAGWYFVAAESGHELALKQLGRLIKTVPGPERTRPPLDDPAAGTDGKTVSDAADDASEPPVVETAGQGPQNVQTMSEQRPNSGAIVESDATSPDKSAEPNSATVTAEAEEAEETEEEIANPIPEHEPGFWGKTWNVMTFSDDDKAHPDN